MDNLESRIEAGLKLEREGNEQAAIEYFRDLSGRYPDNADVRFEYAGAHDFAGHEAEAIPIYREAMRMGLAGSRLPRAYLQLGSSLRNVEQHEEALQVLGEGHQRFPEFVPLRIFRALTLYSAGRCQEAIVELLEAMLADPESAVIGGYSRAIRYYTDEIKAARP